jgi:hypothetical protein
MSQYDDIIQQAASRFNVDPALIRGVIGTESHGNAGAVSNKGAVGLMQIEPSNYESLGITDPKDPTQNIMGGTKMLAGLLDKYGDVTTALRHYQGGDDTSQWGPVNAAYPSKVFAAGGISMPQKTSQTLPGIPADQTQGSLSDDQIFSSFSKGSAPQQQTQGPNDDQILAAFTVPQAAKPAAAAPATPPAQAAAEQPNMLESFAAGLGHGFGSTVLGAQQLLGHGLQAVGGIGESPNLSGLITGQQPQNILGRAGNWLVNDANQGLQRMNQDYSPYAQAHSIAAGAGNFGGSVAATLPLGALAPEAATVGGAIKQGAVMGGLTSAAAPVDPSSNNFWGDKLGQVATGTATGGVLGPAAYGLGRLVSPNVSPDVQMLLDRGVTPTPGQILGGAAATTESKLTSAPGIGDAIVAGQRRAMDQFNRATYQDALDQVGGHLPANVDTGSAGVSYVRNKIGDLYDSVANRASFVADQNFNNDLTQIRSDLAQSAPGALQQFDNIVQNQVTGKLQNGALTGPQWNDSRSMISNLSRRQITGNANADNWSLHDALDDLTTALNDGVGRSSPPDVLGDLQRANAGWARYKQIEKAAGSTGASNNGNVFTPAQYSAAIRSGSTASQKGTNAGLNADFASAAQNILGTKYPDSGTAGRGLLNLLGGGIVTGGLITNPTTTLAGLGGVALGSLPYTAAGQRGLAALLTARPQFTQPVGNAIANFGPRVVAGGLPALLSGSQ